MVTYDKLITSVWGSSWGASMLLRSDELQNYKLEEQYVLLYCSLANLIKLICIIEFTASLYISILTTATR